MQIMASTLPYTFKPQPPPGPKQTGGKRGPSGPLNIASSSSEDEDSDQSIIDFSPPPCGRFILSDLGTGSSGKSNRVITVTNINSPRNSLISKRSSGSLSSPKNQCTTIGGGLVQMSGGKTLNCIGHSNISQSLTQPHSLSLPPTIPSTVTTLASKAPPLSQSNCLTAQTANTPSTCTANYDEDANASNNNSLSGKLFLSANTPPASPRERSLSPSTNFAYEHDHDYENVASPCSSTASGPTYVRPPGFDFHAQEITVSTKKLKKKKSSAHMLNVNGFKLTEATPPKIKPKREPLPMKLRALPQSFWQQPNVPHQVSPAALFPILPPLSQKETEENQIMEVRPVTPPEDRDGKWPQPERKLTVANTDLLFKLFEGVGEDAKKGNNNTKPRIQPGRQRKPMAKSNTKGLFLGQDPYLVEDVTDKIFPTLTLEGSRHPGGGNTSLQVITLKEGDKTVSLPSLSMEQNYPQMLSELVMHM